MGRGSSDAPDAKKERSTEASHAGGYRASYNFYTQGRQGSTVQSVYPSPESLRPILTVSMPVKDEAGELLAVLAMHLGLERIDQIIRSRAGLGETGTLPHHGLPDAAAGHQAQDGHGSGG